MSTMEFIAKGGQADIYKNNGMAVKLFRKDISKYDVEYEMNLQKMACQMGLPVPKIYDMVEIDGKYGIVMDYIEGIPVGKIMLENKKDALKYLIKSIEIQIDLNKIIAANFPPMVEKLEQKINKAYILNEDLIQNILEDLEKITFQRLLCHGDFHVLNLLETTDGIKIIDWVDSSAGNPEFDVCRTYILYSETSEEIAGLYIDNYCKITKTPKNEILNNAPIIAAARLGENLDDENKIRTLKLFIKQYPC